MIIGGINKNSFIDYPDKISSVLFTYGCNFQCPYCHNPMLVNKKNNNTCFIEESDIFDFLKKRKGRIEGVVISGGEPTLHKDIIDFCKKIKAFGYPIKLDTNGSRPDILKQLIHEACIDYIAMDIKTEPLNYSPVIIKNYYMKDILDSIKMIMNSGLAYEFRTTCMKPFIDVDIIERIAKYIKSAMLYVLQKFNDKVVLKPDFFKNDFKNYDDEEMIDLQRIASKWVHQCVIR